MNARCVHAESSVVDRRACGKSIQAVQPRRAIVFILAFLCSSVAFAQTLPRDPAADGRTIYRDACAACHGPDGKGMPPEQVGNQVSVPDFTDCRFTSAERTKDWMAVIRGGGPARGFSRVMPAFGDALTEAEIQLAIGHIRTFCTASRWPPGDLDFPRPLATEKAFPDNETILAFSIPLRQTDTAELRIIYERRVGSRGQVEAAVPFTTRQIGDHWYRGLGDVSAGYKQLLLESNRTGTLVSAAASLTLPTGKEQYGLGTRLTILETSALAGQRIGPAFAHAQAGFEFPLNVASTPNEAFWRGALGAMLATGADGRMWSPMLELSGHREFEYGDPIRWDLLPQLQVSLSRRRHIAAAAGARVPVGGPTRPAIAMVSLMWDWFEGGLMEGWR